MSTQPEALRLADALLAEPSKPTWDVLEATAAELRRLHAQRDALLEALKLIQHATSPTPNDGGQHEAAHDIASAAIAKAEGEKA